jgi:hypothetical protein
MFRNMFSHKFLYLLLLTSFSFVVRAEEPETLDEKPVMEIFLDSLKSPTKASLTDDRDPGESEADRNSDSEPANEPDKSEVYVDPLPESESEDIATSEKPTARLQPAEVKEVFELEPPTPKPAENLVVLTPEMELRRWRIREAMAWHYEHPQRATDRSPWGIMHAMLPYGVDSHIIDTQGRRVNAVGFLCYNNAARGMRMFHLKNGQIAANIGPGLQGHAGQFLSMLAQSKIDPAYPMRIESKSFKVADLIEYEKFTCEAGTELTFKLIALSHYLPHDAKWKNFKGEDWDIPRLIREELKQPVVGAACGGTHRMTGFSYSVRIHEQRKHYFDGQWTRASKFIDSYHDYMYTLHNRDGSYSTNWFASRGDLSDPQRKLQTTGHMVEWLVFSLPVERLNEPQVTRGIDFLARSLNEGRKVKWEIGPLGHALHALALYDERMFGGRPGLRATQLAREQRTPPTFKKR